MKMLKLLASTALAVTAVGSLACAQPLPDGRVYAFHSKAQGGCPALDWHVIAGPNNTLAGMISWDDMKSMARATGAVDMTTHTFKMTAKEVGGQGRTATIDGTVRQDGWLVANIKGPKVTCQGIAIQWFVMTPSSGG